MIQIGACAADFARLLAAENAPKRGFDRFAARFIRRSQIRGHEENGPDHVEFGESIALRIAQLEAAQDCRKRKTSVETENGNHRKEDLPLEKGA
jgi:hypothetical protein